MGFTTWDHLADQVRAQFKKSYTKDLIIESCNTLIQHELLEQAGTGIGATYSITKKGRAVVKEINGLAVKSPDPWRKFTRESYSQNVAV